MQRKVRRVTESPVQVGMNPQHRARHVLDPGRFAESDPFLMLAEDWFVRGTFGEHPHRGFETVTFVIDGEIEHRDNHGGRGVLRPGDAQWMTAGRGVIHSEEAGANGAHSLQLWVNLPAALKMTEPRYQDLRGSAMPVREVPGATLRVYSGSSGEVTAETRTHVPMTMVEMRFDAPASVTQDLPPSYNAFIYVIDGSGRFGPDNVPAHAGQAVWFDDASEPSEIVVHSDGAMHAMLWAGEPIGERIAARGPFVMNTQEELMQAWIDFQSGRF